MSRRGAQWFGACALVIAGVAGLVYGFWPEAPQAVVEAGIVRIPLAEAAARSEAELSGLGLDGETLVLLPQYPALNGQAVFGLELADIERVIDARSEEPLAARVIPFECPDLRGDIPGFDGFEAIAFSGDRFFVTVETHPDASQLVGYLLAGDVVREEGRLTRLVLDTDRRAPLTGQTPIDNLGYEALVVSGDRVIALYEANGELNPAPRAQIFDLELTPIEERPVAPLEYRLTDATAPDSDGHFWVANYHWPGAPWQSGVCALTEQHGRGASHSRCATVERLVELGLTDQGVAPTGRAPIQLALLDEAHPRNWEGLVRLGDRGFLLVTDEHPETILAFVPAR